MTIEGLNVYPIAKPIKDYHDAVATGRRAMYFIDMGGVTLVIAVVYGWTGAKKGTPEAARTDDLLTIIQMQLEALPQGPKLIAGNLNGPRSLPDHWYSHHWKRMGRCWNGE